VRAIAALTLKVTEAPWTLSRRDLRDAHTASLSDEEILHIVSLSSFFGHLNRVADVTGVALDYTVALAAPPTDPAVPAWQAAPEPIVGRPIIEPARRPATYAALAEWRKYIFHRDAPISRRQRTLLARWVAAWLGDGGISPPTDLTANAHDDALRTFAELVTLAPWKIDDAQLAPLRAVGFDDAAIFDATATVTSAGVFSRIEVALIALGT
jgi:alkylhydroperoxidase family enzyme